jgi:hypothetical protein
LVSRHEPRRKHWDGLPRKHHSSVVYGPLPNETHKYKGRAKLRGLNVETGGTRESGVYIDHSCTVTPIVVAQKLAERRKRRETWRKGF